MSLRNLLRRATELRVAHPKERNTQLSRGTDATGTATTAQQTSANPHGIRDHAATVTATATQQGQNGTATCADSGEKLRVAFASTRNTQHGSLTAHRLAKEVIAAAMKRCDEFNDSEAAREEMRRDCLEISPEMQADLLEHFNGKPVQFD